MILTAQDEAIHITLDEPIKGQSKLVFQDECYDPSYPYKIINTASLNPDSKEYRIALKAVEIDPDQFREFTWNSCKVRDIEDFVDACFGKDIYIGQIKAEIISREVGSDRLNLRIVFEEI